MAVPSIAEIRSDLKPGESLGAWGRRVRPVRVSLFRRIVEVLS